MRKTLVFLGAAVVFASCNSAETKSGFDVNAGESRTFSFAGQPVNQVNVRVTTGKVSVVIKYRDKGVLKTSATTSMSRDNAIEEVIVTGSTAASGWLEIR